MRKVHIDVLLVLGLVGGACSSEPAATESDGDATTPVTGTQAAPPAPVEPSTGQPLPTAQTASSSVAQAESTANQTPSPATSNALPEAPAAPPSAVTEPTAAPEATSLPPQVPPPTTAEPSDSTTPPDDSTPPDGPAATDGPGPAATDVPPEPSDDPSPKPGDLVVSPDGADDAPGTSAEPTTLISALTRIAAGATISLRGGTYTFASQLTIDVANSGLEGNPKRIAPYGDEHPHLDFASEPYGADSNPRGLQLDGSYWHIERLELSGAADNGMYVTGNHNVIDGCVLHDNRDTGLQIGRRNSDVARSEWPSYNLILNCESYDNYDAPPGGGENADGFASKLTSGPGNVFRGCVAHHNIDDGWDLFTKPDTGPIDPVTIDQCIAYANGTLTDGTSNESGDRNGFKLGGDKIAVAHIVTRSVAFGNGKNGFTWNSNPGAIRLSNTLAFDNVAGNYKFGDNSTPTDAVFSNNLSFWTQTASDESDKAVGSDTSSNNVWWDDEESPQSVNPDGLTAGAGDFGSNLMTTVVTRNPDGSIDFGPFALAPSSSLLDAGALPGGELPFDAATYYVAAPDIGAVESR